MVRRKSTKVLLENIIIRRKFIDENVEGKALFKLIFVECTVRLQRDISGSEQDQMVRKVVQQQCISIR
jgi:hypothetical protein